MGVPIFDPATGTIVDSETGQPVQVPGFGPVGAAAGLQAPDPGIVEQAAGPVTSPSQLDPQAQPQQPQGPAVAPTPQSAAESQTFGYGGWSPVTSTAIEATANKRVRPQIAAATDQANADARQEGALVAGAAQGEMDASDRVYGAEAAKMVAEQEAFNARARLEGDILAAEALGNVHAEAASDAAKSRYMGAIQSYNALQVTPVLPMSKAMSAGVAMAEFAQGFLAAGGTKIDVTGILDRATNRYVDTQMERVRRGEQLVGMAKTEWDMVRAEATDEADARARWRLLALSQADTSMQAESAKYGSQLALARGEEARAKIKTQMANALTEIGRRARDVAYRDIQAINQDFIQRQQLAISRTNAATSRRAQLFAEDQAKKKEDAAKLAGNPDALVDVSQSGQNQAKWLLTRGTPKQKDDVRNAANAQAAIGNAINDAIKYAAEAREKMSPLLGKFPFVDGGNLEAFAREQAPDVVRLYEQTINRIVQNRVRVVTGAASTDQERREVRAQIPFNTWITEANVDKLYANFALSNLDELDAMIGQYADPLVQNAEFAPGERALWTAVRDGEQRLTSELEDTAARTLAGHPGGDMDVLTETASGAKGATFTDPQDVKVARGAIDRAANLDLSNPVQGAGQEAQAKVKEADAAKDPAVQVELPDGRLMILRKSFADANGLKVSTVETEKGTFPIVYSDPASAARADENALKLVGSN